MIDIHSHILFGIDDGPENKKETIDLCKRLSKLGITSVVATPHYISEDEYAPSPKLIKEKIHKLCKVLTKKRIKLQIFPGTEIYLSHDTAEKLKNGELLSLNNSRYVLVEFSLNNIPNYIKEVLFSIMVEGYIPIIAHPERYCSDFYESGLLTELVDRGVLLQINAGSILGKHGKRAQKRVKKLLKKSMVHFVASDSHNKNRIMPDIKLVEKEIEKICGKENTQRIMYVNPVNAIEDNEIQNMEKNNNFLFLSRLVQNLRFDYLKRMVPIKE